MNKLALTVIALLIISAGAVAQSSRPRVAATPAPPVLQGDSPNRDGRSGPPVLGGADQRTAPTSAPEEVKSEQDSLNDDEVVRVETSLVTMPVSVIDRDGRFISGLQQGDFQIFENGVQQKIEYFQSVEQPFTVILMIDVSPSTQWQIEEIHTAAMTFIDQLRPSDKVMVVAFDESVQILSPVTNNRYVLHNAIRQARFGDGTGLYEAVDEVLNRELRRIQGRKAVVLFTDGVDTTSRQASYMGTLRDVEESDALFYPIRYDTARDMNVGMRYPGPSRRGQIGLGGILGTILNGGSWPVPIGGAGAGNSRAEYETGKRYLETLALNSGGRKFEADSLTNLDAAFSGIAEELRRQYSLGYYPDKVGNVGDRKQIRIRVARPNLVVRAKTSYVVGDTNRGLAGR